MDAMLVTVDEAAKQIGLGRTVVYQLIRRGALHSIKIGGARRVAISDLIDFVERVRTTGEVSVDG